MAEALFRSMVEKENITGVRVWSRGLAAVERAAMPGDALGVLKAVGVDATLHRAAQLAPNDVAEAWLILVMEGRHRDLLEKQFPESVGKTFLLRSYAETDGSPDIDDPMGGSPEDYEKCRIEIQSCLLGLLDKLKSHLKDQS